MWFVKEKEARPDDPISHDRHVRSVDAATDTSGLSAQQEIGVGSDHPFRESFTEEGPEEMSSRKAIDSQINQLDTKVEKLLDAMKLLSELKQDQRAEARSTSSRPRNPEVAERSDPSSNENRHDGTGHRAAGLPAGSTLHAAGEPSPTGYRAGRLASGSARRTALSLV